MKQINKLKIIMLTLIIIGTTLSIIGLISTNKQQKTKKQIITENMLFTYETIKNNNYNKSLTEKEGLMSNYQEIKISSSSSSSAQMNYLIYIKPKANNDIKDEEINVYITDEKNIPVSEEYKDLQNGKGKYCYDYINKIKYNIETPEYQKYCLLNNLKENESKYIMDSNYIENINNKTKICKKYTNVNNNLKETIVDNVLCQFGDLYEGKSIPLQKYNDIYDVKNVILASTHLHKNKSTQTNIYRIRLWQKKIEDNSSNKKYKYDIDIYPIKVN